ncbi:cytochrome c oxidase subunit II [Nocardioides sp. TRM66260-LWL]|uniref:aa3-type cytochrome oxidase subunit II n=1 Tax=Nocardioides sp. TRM66260-LWL TaxID=2874478 RepID=UPI001CC6EDBA|nr:cytochrome c oxidase subunit II [Nocardioides sp. TRM66260-LWL]MBZ5734332.1 cytochrome c oxidase subunit II [Nocardioides sp. TRM66260-LWL]
MSLQLPRRTARLTRASRTLALTVTLAGLMLMAGCSSETSAEWKRFAMPDPVTKQGESTLALWRGAWIAALITGVVVWGLIAWVVVRYRRRHDDEVPVQTRYNLPLEIFYTIAPVMMVIVFFAHTVRVQNIVLDDSVQPDQTIQVVGQQWSWTFNYPLPDDIKAEAGGQGFAYESGTASYIPTLVLPNDETTRFQLTSPDVIHDFGVPGFLIKMDVIPGRKNSFQVTPQRTGEFAGKCYELCGVYHSRMLFNVKVVSPAEYDAYLRDRVKQGYVSDQPLLGGSDATTQAGLKSEGEAQ